MAQSLVLCKPPIFQDSFAFVLLIVSLIYILQELGKKLMKYTILVFDFILSDFNSPEFEGIRTISNINVPFVPPI